MSPAYRLVIVFMVRREKKWTKQNEFILLPKYNNLKITANNSNK